MERDRWDETISGLSDFQAAGIEAAEPLAELVAWARPRWGGQVNVHTSMHTLQFTNYADTYPWPALVQVEWQAGVYTLILQRDREPEPVASDRCRESATHDALDAFLQQLLGQLGRTAPPPKAARGRGPLCS
jgi:hypothetical protein